MSWISTCPVDQGQKEFFGISSRPTGQRDAETNDPIIERFVWRTCTVCGVFLQEDFNGMVISRQQNEPPASLFKVARDA